MTKSFRDLDVDPALCDALAADGIINPFPIQELTLPLALDGHDLIGQARTGTGKTLAFGLPLLQRVDPSSKRTQALVIVPTRELCLQVYEDLKIGAARGVTSINVYGGVAYEEQTEALTGGVHVVVGTPGRLLDHLNRGTLDLSNVTELVLDEADEMLDMGFLPDVERLVEACKGEDRHTMLFSATMPTAIVKLARRYMNHPTFTRADHEERSTAPEVEQHFFQVHRMDKPRLLARILQTEGRRGVFVFVRTKHMADRLVDELEQLGTAAIAVHGDLRQSTREKNLDRFRRGEATVLVCTEVAARGLDVTGVTHVVNYDCPDDEKMYLHRIGRTARAGEQGVAITFAEFNEIDRLSVIRKAVGASERAVQQVFSTSPLLAELFDLPETRPWDHLSKSSSSAGTDRKRQGRTDGRPKSDRAREGRGDRHDAKRAASPAPSRPTRSASKPAAKSAAAEGDTSGDPATVSRDRPRDAAGASGDRSRGSAGDRGDRSPRGGTTGSRTRTRSRSRTRDGNDERGDRPNAETDNGDEARTRRERAGSGDADRRGSGGRADRRGSRSRAGDATAEKGADRDDSRSVTARNDTARSDAANDDTGTKDARGDDGSRPEPAPRRRRARPAGSAGSGSSDRRDAAAKDDQGSRGRGASAARGGDAGGSQRDRKAKSGDEARSEGSSRGGKQPRGKRGGPRSRGGGQAQPQAQTAPDRTQRTQPRGTEARGDGRPQPARRVKVEHLP